MYVRENVSHEIVADSRTGLNLLVYSDEVYLERSVGCILTGLFNCWISGECCYFQNQKSEGGEAVVKNIRQTG